MGAYAEAMTSSVAALRAQLAEARMQVNGGFSIGVAADLQDQYNGQLNQAEATINRLDTDLRAQVDSGDLDISNWRAIAQQQVELMSSTQSASVNDVPDLSKFFSQVVAKSVTDLGTAAEAAVPSSSTLKWYTVAAIAALLLLVVFKAE
jgi:hypothetical protein